MHPHIYRAFLDEFQQIKLAAPPPIPGGVKPLTQQTVQGLKAIFKLPAPKPTLKGSSLVSALKKTGAIPGTPISMLLGKAPAAAAARGAAPTAARSVGQEMAGFKSLLHGGNVRSPMTGAATVRVNPVMAKQPPAGPTAGWFRGPRTPAKGGALSGGLVPLQDLPPHIAQMRPSPAALRAQGVGL